MKIWIPADNRDHQVDISDKNPRNWKVLKGTKTVNQLIKENLENITKREPLSTIDRINLKNHYGV